MLLKYILKLSIKFLKQLWSNLLLFGKWIRRPKVYKSILGILVTVFSLSWGFYTYYYPSIDVVYTEPLDSNNIFSSRFTIENNGNCNIYDVHFEYDFDDIALSQKSVLMVDINITNRGNSTVYKRIKKKRGQTIDVDFINTFFEFENSNKSDMTTYKMKAKIEVTYTYWNYFTKSETFNFHTSELISDKIVWLKDQ
ncbi:hypothetical protein [Flagellimonas oceani]|nr:hypothetical protein [Allomuricauda oceani]